MELDFRIIFNEVEKIIEQNKIWYLATSKNDKVTARAISIVNEGLNIFFQTDIAFEKYKQMEFNKNVALVQGNVQIEGISTLLGHPLEEGNEKFIEKFSAAHTNAYSLYSHLEGNRVIKISPVKITMWKYEKNRPYRDFILVEDQKAYREYYL